MAENKVQKPPTDLGPDGRAFWRDVLEEYDLRVDELRLLSGACRALDRAVRLSEAASGADLTVKGSHGGTQVNPLIAEARQQELLFARLTRQMGLADPDDDTQVASGGEAASAARSSNARRAAQARWAAR